MTIWTGEDAAEKANPPSDVAFETDGPTWDDQAGDVADLVDPDGQVVASVEVVPENFSLVRLIFREFHCRPAFERPCLGCFAGGRDRGCGCRPGW